MILDKILYVSLKPCFEGLNNWMKTSEVQAVQLIRKQEYFKLLIGLVCQQSAHMVLGEILEGWFDKSIWNWEQTFLSQSHRVGVDF